MENFWRPAHPPTHFQPVTKIISHIIAAERQHGHGIPSYHPDIVRGGGCCLRGHGGPDESTVLPVESLVNQRSDSRPAPAENNRGNRNPFGILPFRRDRRTLPRRRSEP